MISFLSEVELLRAFRFRTLRAAFWPKPQPAMRNRPLTFESQALAASRSRERSESQKGGVRRSFNTATVWEQHPGSHYKGATSLCMQTHPAVRVGFELAIDGIRASSVLAK